MEATTTLSDVDRTLTAADKAELQTFITHTQQRGIIQQRTHTMTDRCFKQCVTTAIRSSALERAEQACLTNCVERFFDLAKLTVQHMQESRR